ncbi:MAG: RagB/SusD family nutrient uptake outer membrane protein [Bacteroidetes bacterium]|nr:RagB/SusD family nutrient uptake outer membrane protein [Fibrella sp.]
MRTPILLLVLGLLGLAGCRDSFLETQPTDRFTQQTFWKTREHAEAALNGTYASLLNNNLYGGNAPIFWDGLTPNAFIYNNPNGFGNIAQGIHDAANTGLINNLWGACYGGIGRANNLLANVNAITMDETLKKRYVAEVKFLRALFYHQLVTLYGGVPLIVNATNVEEQANLPRSVSEAVVAQVLKDLTEAAPDLPLTYGAGERGRATRGAALTLRARVLLYQGRWVEAAAAAKSVMDLKTYSLFPDYRGLFLLENEGNAEVIFDAQFKFPEFPHGFDVNLDQFNGTAPLPGLINDYYLTDGRSTKNSPLFNPQKPFENRDPRLLATVMYIGSQYKGAPVTESQYPQTGYGQKKYTIYRDTERPVAIKVEGQSELNFIILRYADVLLMYAEAQNEALGPDASIYDAVNLIRKRAQMPNLPAGLSKDAMREEIRHERRIELAGEALYYFDIRRWRTAEKVMNGDVTNAKGQRIGTRRFDAARDYLWPIPSVAIQLNPALTQNPGYNR